MLNQNSILVSAGTAGGGGSVTIATQGEVDAGTNNTKAVSPLTLHGNVSPQFAARAPRQGVTSDGTAILGTTQNTGSNFDFGTNDVTLFLWVKPDDWTPSGVQTIMAGNGDNLGLLAYILNDGTLRVGMGNGSGYTLYVSTEATELTDGEWALLTFSLDRDGNLIFGVNGQQLGDPVSISAQSAQTLTSTYPSEWGRTFEGAMGEAGIAQGALTAAQVAEIHANGTAQGLGLTTYQHLVPTDTLAAGIFEDVSGNNNHAALGGIPSTNGIDTVLPVELPAETVKVPALRSDGSDGSRIYATLNDQDPGTGDFLLRWDVGCIEDLSGTSKYPASLTSSISDIYQARSVHWYYDTGIGLGFRMLGATTGDSRKLTSLSLAEVIFEHIQAGYVVGLSASRSASGLAIYYRVNGLTLDVTNLFTEATGGTAPAWTDTITATYLVGIYRNSTTSSAQDLHDLRLYNAAPDTLAEAADAMSPTPVGAKWQPVGDQTFYAPTFATTDSWVQLGGAVQTPTVASNELVLEGTNTDGQLIIYRSSTLTAGNYYRITATFRLDANVVSDGVAYVGLRGNGSVMIDGTAKQFDGGTSDQTFTWEGFLSDSSYTGSGDRLSFVFNPDGSTTVPQFTIDTSDFLYIHSVTVGEVGQTVGLDLADGGGYQPKNPRAENGSTNWEMSTTGIDWTVPANAGKRIAITKTYNWTEISSTALTTLLGSLPPSWGYVDTFFRVVTAFDAGTTVDIGGGGSATRFHSAAVMDAAGYVEPDGSGQQRPLSPTSINGIYIAKNQVTTQGEVAVTVILERAF